MNDGANQLPYYSNARGPTIRHGQQFSVAPPVEAPVARDSDACDRDAYRNNGPGVPDR